VIDSVGLEVPGGEVDDVGLDQKLNGELRHSVFNLLKATCAPGEPERTGVATSCERTCVGLSISTEVLETGGLTLVVNSFLREFLLDVTNE
jgi:hypothetical protein